ncbi:GSCFA domain-containing protein [Portibacter marinus]|uniref:GSCFA domain-containing protein n=1 Tax=Portibacter marinus TaxID=2898660 RepID=UPI001F32FC7F|nr:GSCFA domain-containing protein [Portibacter marinus]
MKFRTELKNYESKEIIDYSKKILCIGSCFAEHLHRYLIQMKFKSYLNPCGITYNPISMAESIYYYLGQVKVKQEDIFENHGIYAHYDFHSDFSGLSRTEVSEKIKLKQKEASNFGTPDVLILSLGTAFTYFLLNSDEAVNNCHKVPQKNFVKKRLSVHEVVEVLHRGIKEMKALNNEMDIIVTVSPVRHLRDGMIENNLSKSTLLLAASQLDGVTYFPSYELLLDDLRDYRYFRDDMVHPTKKAIDYILNFFIGQCFNAQESELRKRIFDIKRDLAHRPFFKDSENHLAFLNKLLERIKTLQAHSTVDLEEEKQEVMKRINK